MRHPGQKEKVHTYKVCTYVCTVHTRYNIQNTLLCTAAAYRHNKAFSALTTTYCLRTNCLLPTAHCSLPTAHCLLPTAYYIQQRDHLTVLL